MTRGRYGSDTGRFGRGHYGRTTNLISGPDGVRPIIRIPVLDEVGEPTKRAALWDLPGRLPAFYVESVTGTDVWLFDDPNGGIGLFGRRFRMYHPFTKPTLVPLAP